MRQLNLFTDAYNANKDKYKDFCISVITHECNKEHAWLLSKINNNIDAIYHISRLLNLYISQSREYKNGNKDIFPIMDMNKYVIYELCIKINARPSFLAYYLFNHEPYKTKNVLVNIYMENREDGNLINPEVDITPILLYNHD